MTADAALSTEIAERLAKVRTRIESAGGSDVTLVGVTKAFGIEAIEAAMHAGLSDIGESYAQEALAKLSELAEPARLEALPRVHFVGRLQRNKVRRLAGLVDVWQSVDRAELGAEIAKRAPGATVLIQVDISGEPAKGGVAPDEAPRLLHTLRTQGLDVAGVMGIAALGSPGEARRGFRMLRRLRDQLGLAECSMGMSADLEIAVAEGATMVRVGTDVFGPRPAIRPPRSARH